MVTSNLIQWNDRVEHFTPRGSIHRHIDRDGSTQHSGTRDLVAGEARLMRAASHGLDRRKPDRAPCSPAAVCREEKWKARMASARASDRTCLFSSERIMNASHLRIYLFVYLAGDVECSTT